MYVFAWYCKWSLVLVSCNGTNITFLWLFFLHLIVYLPLSPNRSWMQWWTMSVCLFPTDKIIQGYFCLTSVVMRPSISSCLVFSFIHISQHITGNDMNMCFCFLCQGHKATLCQVKNLTHDVSLSLELRAGWLCQVSGSVIAKLGGIAIRFSCGSGRCLFHLDQEWLLIYSKRPGDIWVLASSLDVPWVCGFWSQFGTFALPTWPMLLWSLPLL